MNRSFIVSKFGGTSMGDIQAMERSAVISIERNPSVVVVSATSGTTDKLIQVAKLASAGNIEECDKIVFGIKERHQAMMNELPKNYDSFEILNSYFTELDLNNGCDNSYEFLFSKVDYQDLLKGTKNQIQVRLDYFFVADFEDEADEEGITEGHLNATCIKTKPQSTELGPTF